MIVVYIAIIDHKHGQNVYVADSFSNLEEVVYKEYVTEWWDEDPDLRGQEIPEEHEEALTMYFHENSREHISYYDQRVYTGE